jgi:ubiquinone/menaquinone biosynthesis C-methylase UbiE
MDADRTDPGLNEPEETLSAEVLTHYSGGMEQARLLQGSGQLELARTQELLARYLMSPPAVIYDVGGGPGTYALWLARAGYEVHLIDAVPHHVDQAREASREQAAQPLASTGVGDARNLAFDDQSADGVLLMGPLYHLIEQRDRIRALQEAARVVKPGGLIFAVGISRFASMLDGLFHGMLDDPAFFQIARQDLATGQHRNPTDHPDYFTTAFLHHPEELTAEIEAAGLRLQHLLAIEGPGWLVPDFSARWQEQNRRERLLDMLRQVESDPALLGASAHLMAIARSPAQ